MMRLMSAFAASLPRPSFPSTASTMSNPLPLSALMTCCRAVRESSTTRIFFPMGSFFLDSRLTSKDQHSALFRFGNGHRGFAELDARLGDRLHSDEQPVAPALEQMGEARGTLEGAA